MTEVEKLQAKLRAVEPLFAGTTHAGERDAAARARERIVARIAEMKTARTVEWRFSLDRYTRHLLIALARRYGLEPYRYRRQRWTTLLLRAPESFLKEVFLPEYDRMVEVLHERLAISRRPAHVRESEKVETSSISPSASSRRHSTRTRASLARRRSPRCSRPVRRRRCS